MATRTATPDDLPRMAQLLAELRGRDVAVASIKPQFAEFYDGTHRTAMVVTNEDGDVVGLAVLNLVYKLSKIECRLDEVIVADAERGKGYGRKLIEACEAWAWSQNADVLEFTSRPGREAANAMYQKLGFELRETNVYLKRGS